MILDLPGSGLLEGWLWRIIFLDLQNLWKRCGLGSAEGFLSLDTRVFWLAASCCSSGWAHWQTALARRFHVRAENIGWRSAVLDSLFWDPISDHTDSDDESVAATSWSDDEEGMSLLDATTDMEDTPGDSKEDVSKSDVMPRDLSLLQRKTPQGHLTRSITDGAKLYPKTARDFSLKRHAGNHSKRVFCNHTHLGVWQK